MLGDEHTPICYPSPYEGHHAAHFWDGDGEADITKDGAEARSQVCIFLATALSQDTQPLSEGSGSC